MSGPTLRRIMGWLGKRFGSHAVTVPTLEQMMVSEPVCVTREISLADAIDIIDEKGFDQLPVVTDHESRHLVGAITSRQIAIWARDWAQSGASVSDAMETPWDGLDRNPQDKMGDELLEYFGTYDFVVVVDDQERVIGIVQLWDIANELWEAQHQALAERH